MPIWPFAALTSASAVKSFSLGADRRNCCTPSRMAAAIPFALSTEERSNCCLTRSSPNSSFLYAASTTPRHTFRAFHRGALQLLFEILQPKLFLLVRSPPHPPPYLSRFPPRSAPIAV